VSIPQQLAHILTVVGRFKPEMWQKVAEEMQVPWRAAEAMHWQLGEADMARRAGVIPFSLNMAGIEHPMVQRVSPTRGHTHSQSQGSLPRDLPSMPSPRYSRGPGPGPGPSTPLIPPPLPSSSRPMAVRRDSVPPRPYGHPEPPELAYGMPGPAFGGLAPIQTVNVPQGRGGGLLPSVAELTTGVSPYSTPAYSVGVPSASPVHSATASPGPGPSLPSMSAYQPLEPPGAKRRASPESASRNSSRRRQPHPLHDELDRRGH